LLLLLLLLLLSYCCSLGKLNSGSLRDHGGAQHSGHVVAAWLVRSGKALLLLLLLLLLLGSFTALTWGIPPYIEFLTTEHKLVQLSQGLGGICVAVEGQDAEAC